jgi:carboxypeptidase family protein
MPKLRNLSVLVLLALVAFAVGTDSPPAYAQTAASSATLSGSVSDSSGARVAGATVTISSLEKGITRTFKTDPEGNFSFPLLPAATYTLAVSASGFKTFRLEGITLEVGQSASQSVALTIGSSEQIEVTAQAPLLQTDNANLGAEVSTKMVTEMPLNLRNVFNFVQLNSSVSNSQRQLIESGGSQGTADQDVSFFNFGGGFFGTTAFLLDGAWDSIGSWGGVIYVPSPDNVQEFKLQQHSFTAQYGWSTGNVVNVVTKSGGSSLHGNAYEYLRNGKLDANYYFNAINGTPKQNSHRNQFGLALGGPVYIPGLYKQRDKTFFFFNWESHRQNDPLTANVDTVPIPAFRTGDFSALLGGNIGTDALCRPILGGQIYDPFSTRQVTATCGPNSGSTVWIRDPISGNNLANAINGIDAVGQNLINFYPAPINSQVSGNWTAAGLGANNSDEFSGRIDHNVSDNTRLYGRYSYKKEFKDEAPAYFGASNPAGPGQRNPNNRYSIAFGGSHVFSPVFTMSGNLGLMHWVEGNDMQSKGFKVSSIGLPAFIDPISPQFPVISATGYRGLGPQQGAGQGAFPRAAATGSLDFVKVGGKHQLGFGYMAIALTENGGRFHPTPFNFDNVFTAGPDPTNINPLTGNSMASLLLGTPASGNTGIAVSQISRQWLHGVYLQDDWKATRKLTLNLGIRWEIPRPVTDRLDRLARFDYNAVNPISAVVGNTYHGKQVFANSDNRGQYSARYNEVAPRFGFAFQLIPKLVMRGGYGIFYPRQYPGVPIIPGFGSDTPYVASTNGIGPCAGCLLRNAFSGGLVPVVGKSLGGLTNVGFDVTAVSPSRKTYYVQQWSYGFQYAPNKSDVIELSYVGNHSVHITTGGFNLNQLDPKYLSMGNALDNQVANPFFGQITSSGCGLDQPTIQQGQLLRPYPEFCNINENLIPGGSGSYNALDLNYTHRVTQGLTLLASYTFSKFLDNVGGPTTWANTSANFSENIRNVYNLAAEKSVDPNDITHAFVLSYVYELPVGKSKKIGGGMNSVLNAVVGGWQTSGIATFKGGFPLRINVGNLNEFGIGQNVNVVGDYHVSTPNRFQWFNPAAFAQAPKWTLGNAPRYFSDLRAPGYNNWDMSIQKYFPIHEDVRLQFRLDMFNAFNHVNFYKPDTNFGSGTIGTLNAAWGPRQMQAALKLYW